ncbi:hypothetical protein [Paenibacillus sp. FSL R10-2778]|uniref:hypothetical protein n=1 Tax=Paenibacillus sp. FSL R10-2778 TaxID=2954659 RepID=UPI003158651A
MSESGKVSLPTPERIEAYRKYAHLNNGLSLEDAIELLAALEESRQEGERLNEICKQLAGEEMLFQDGKYETEMQRVQGKLVEAQQTIARAITIYETADMESDFDNVLTGMYEALKVTEGKS